jgi:predicted short-subunit dehydrogenase-like oxidoreductase (DUF2520 family)
MEPAKLNIGIAGSGRLATYFVAKFNEIGVHPICIYSRNSQSGQRLAEACKCQFANHVKEVTTIPDIWILAVSDDAILQVGSQLSTLNTEALLIHVSGGFNTSELIQVHPNAGVVYPLQSFSNGNPINTESFPVFIYAHLSHSLSIVKSIASILSDKVIYLEDNQRIKLHLAAVIVNNFPNLLYQLSSEIMKSAELPFEHLMPLISETTLKLQTMSPSDAQTGPALRGDIHTMEKHLELLQKFPEEYAQLYTLCSELINKLKVDKK